jgi:hypothetical protein
LCRYTEAEKAMVRWYEERGGDAAGFPSVGLYKYNSLDP